MESLLSIFGDNDIQDGQQNHNYGPRNDNDLSSTEMRTIPHHQQQQKQPKTKLSHSKSLLNFENSSVLPPECEHGNVEYKLKLNPNRLENLITQMKWRLEEGDGEAIYEIGVEDNGVVKGLTDDELNSSFETLRLMATKNNASVRLMATKNIESTKGDKKSCKALEVLVKKIPTDKQAIEIRISVIGNVESGKSSLLGVLTQGELDNGKGRARLNLFRHRHEIRSGRTSSINKEILGFDCRGKPITYCNYQTPEEICELSSKIVVFIDSGGHPKFLKTTVFSLTATHADYAILVINSLSKIDCGTNLLHLSLAIALEVPILVVINKIDLCDISTIDNILNQTKQVISSSICKNKIPLTVQQQEDIYRYRTSASKRNLVPIFLISCVSGEGLQLLYEFLHLLEPSLDSKNQDQLIKQNSTFQIDEMFNIPNLDGVVASGFLSSGLIEEGSILKAGPLDDGHFVDVMVSSVQRHKVSRRVVRPGESSTLALNIRNGHSNQPLSKIIRKGMVLLSKVDPDSICHYFQAQIFSMPHSAVISLGSTAIVFIQNVRQSGVILAIQNKEHIHANESATIVIRFLRRPEYIRNGYRLLLQLERANAFGHVTKVFF